MSQEDWEAGLYLPSETTAELISTPTLVQIDEDLWVNPAHVVGVAMATLGDPSRSLPYEKVPSKTVVSYSNGKHAVVDKPLSEVVALINGSAE